MYITRFQRDINRLGRERGERDEGERERGREIERSETNEQKMKQYMKG